MTDHRDELSDETRLLVEREGQTHLGSPGDDGIHVSPLDRGFLYGDGVFETVRCYDGEPAFVQRHVDRLNSSLERLGIDRGFRASEVRESIRKTVDQSWREKDSYIRVTVTRGKRRGLLEPTETEPTVVWTAKPLDHRKRRYPSASVETAETRRPLGIVGRHKTLNYLPNTVARSETAEGTDEALMLDADGNVGSGAVSNIFLVWEDDDGVTVATPAEGVREGVTREVVFEIADEVGFERKVAEITQSELRNAESAFLTNTTWGIRKMEELDGEPVGSHESVDRIASCYFDRVVGE